MSERYFLMQPQRLLPNHNVAGWYVSNKLKGTRCFWDGGISRGMSVIDVPWNASKVSNEVSTGLWTQCGLPLHKSDQWLNQLPCIPLDGILLANNEFAITSSPPYESIFTAGVINGNGITSIGMRNWLNSRPESLLVDYRFLPRRTSFEEELVILNEAVPSEGQIYLLQQHKLPDVPYTKTLEYLFKQSEYGLILRSPVSVWEPIESSDFLVYSKE